jgi:long-chain fatty acid transport protein
VNDRFSIGVGAFSPFGLITEYDPSWVGRYHAVKSDLKTANISPSAAYRLTDTLSVGGGADIQYIRAELSSAIDFGTIFGSLGVPGMTPQGSDGSVTLKGDSWAVGYNLGVLYEFLKDSRTGIAYRSRIKQKIDGEARFSGVPSPNPTGRFLDTGIKADITLPDSLSVSHWHNLSQGLAVMAGITWTNWSMLDELRVRFDNPLETDAVTTTEWKDSFRYAVGIAYKPGAWTYRAGAAYETTPVRNAALRTPRIPDNDRSWISAGVGYKLSDTLDVNAGYARLFVKKPEIRKTPTSEDQLRGGLSGSYDTKVDIIGADLTWVF